MIVPDGHDKNHSFLQGCSHVSETSLSLELVAVTKSSLLGITEGVGDGVAGHASDGGGRVGNDNAILNIESFDLGQGAGRCTVTGDELGDDRELGSGINSHSLSIEAGSTHTVGVVIASVSITKSRVSGVDSTIGSSATSLLSNRARMTKLFKVSCRLEVIFEILLTEYTQRTLRSLPRCPSRYSTIHTVLTQHSCHWQMRSNQPSWPWKGNQLNVTKTDQLRRETYFSVDELDILRTLGITISGSILGTSLVCRESAHSSVFVHLREIECAVETARKVGHINVKCELLAEQLEHLIFGRAASSHQVCSRSDIARTAAFRHEVELESIARGCDAISTGVVGSVQSTVGGTLYAIWAHGCIPGVTSVAIGIPSLGVKPSPVGIEHNGLSRRRTSTSSTFADRESRVGLGCVRTSQLGASSDQEGSEGKSR